MKVLGASTKDDYLDIKLNNRNQVDDTMAWSLVAGCLYLCLQLLPANTISFYYGWMGLAS